MPEKARILALKASRIYFPARTRLCKTHHYKNEPWKNVTDEKIFMYTYTPAQVEEMVDLLRRSGDMETPCSNVIKGEEHKNLFGVTSEEFAEVMALTPSLMIASKTIQKAEMALRMYLMRLRTGCSYAKIITKFNSTMPTVNKLIKMARVALVRDLVPHYVGFKNLTREFLKEHMTNQARILCCDGNADAVVTVWDCTYIFCWKSGNYTFQRSTYSGHKKSNLVKPMLCVCPDGYIVDIFTENKATINDAVIMKYILQHNLEIRSVLVDNDVFVVDRGFRDVIEDLKKLKFHSKMPAFGDFTQPNAPLSTAKANQSRLVTKVRWVVEARNGHLKSIWSIFAKKWSGRDVVSYLNDDMHIAAALINKFSAKLLADHDDETIATEMLETNKRVDSTHIIFHSIVRQTSFKRNFKRFLPIGSDFFFPSLSKDDLKQFGFGSYQLKEARHYFSEHIKNSEDSAFKCLWCPHEILYSKFACIIDQENMRQPMLILTTLASRFRSQKSYISLILADESKNGLESIIAYYCQCKHGLRTVGSCSHVMTTLFYLGYARRTGDLRSTAPYLDNYFHDAPSTSSSALGTFEH